MLPPPDVAIRAATPSPSPPPRYPARPPLPRSRRRNWAARVSYLPPRRRAGLSPYSDPFPDFPNTKAYPVNRPDSARSASAPPRRQKRRRPATNTRRYTLCSRTRMRAHGAAHSPAISSAYRARRCAISPDRRALSPHLRYIPPHLAVRNVKEARLILPHQEVRRLTRRCK